MVGGEKQIFKRYFMTLMAAACFFSPTNNKHCQRHNGPRVLTPYLELSLKLISKQTVEIIRDTESIPWVCCASGNVSQLTRMPLFQIWPSVGATCIVCKFSNHVASHALVVNFTIF